MDKSITSIELACAKLGRDPKLQPDVSMLPEAEQKKVLADYWLPIVIKAINDGWVSDPTDRNQVRYFVYAWLKKDANSPSGFVFSVTNDDYAGTAAIVGARHEMESSAAVFHLIEHFEQLLIEVLT